MSCQHFDGYASTSISSNQQPPPRHASVNIVSTEIFDHVTQKTTEQYLIVRIGKSEAKVTNNKKRCSKYCTVEGLKQVTVYEASCRLSATAELLVVAHSYGMLAT